MAMDICVNLGYVIQITTIVLKEKTRIITKLMAALEEREAAGDSLHNSDSFKRRTSAATVVAEEDRRRAMLVVSNPRVAYLCANLYFAEVTEVLGPLVMGTCSLVVYYLVPTDNRQFLSFMDPRKGVTEAAFLQGMTFVLVDAALEGLLLVALVVYMRSVVQVDPMRVGWFCVKRHREYYFWITLCVCNAILCMFIYHNG